VKELPDLSQYKNRLLVLIRQQEARKALGNVDRLEELAETSDDFLLKKYIWTICLLGGPAVFVAMPLLLCVLGIFTPAPIMEFFWFFTKVGMAIVLLVFCLAVFFTLRVRD
jgi:hypothetical protein